MIKKPITIKNISKIKKTQPAPDKLIDQWVNEEKDNVEIKNYSTPVEEETRFTIVIPTYLHRRIKKYCASHSISMKQKLIEVFKESFPET